MGICAPIWTTVMACLCEECRDASGASNAVNCARLDKWHAIVPVEGIQRRIQTCSQQYYLWALCNGIFMC